MTNDVHPAAILLEVRVPSHPETVEPVRLNANGFDHLLSMMRHEQRNIQQHSVGKLSHIRDGPVDRDVYSKSARRT